MDATGWYMDNDGYKGGLMKKESRKLDEFIEGMKVAVKYIGVTRMINALEFELVEVSEQKEILQAGIDHLKEKSQASDT